MNTLSSRYGYRTAVVTGASSGLGLAFARMLHQEGLAVYVTSRDGRRLPTEAGYGPLALDLTRPGAACEAAAAVCLAVGSVPDVLVNNAGAALFSALERFPATEVGRQLHLLLEEPIHLACAFLPTMLARNRGAIVNVSSLATEFPIPGLGIYSAAKAGFSGFTRALMLETAASGVQIVDFQPGDYHTNFYLATRRPQTGEPWEQRAWERFRLLVRNGPEPARAAQDLRRALWRGRSGTVHSGRFLHTRIGPLAYRLLGQRCLHWVVRQYYGLA